MQVIIVLRFNLETGKRTHREVVYVDDSGQEVSVGQPATQLLLPTRLPREWVPGSTRVAGGSVLGRLLDGAMAPAAAPEGLPGSLHAVPDPADNEPGTARESL